MTQWAYWRCVTIYCTCFPFFEAHNKNKFEFHNSKCVFIGYSDYHKCCKCLDKSSWVYISRSMTFHEWLNSNSLLGYTLYSQNQNFGVLKQFHLMAERSFNTKLKCLHSDMKGRYPILALLTNFWYSTQVFLPINSWYQIIGFSSQNLKTPERLFDYFDTPFKLFQLDLVEWHAQSHLLLIAIPLQTSQ